VVEIVLSREGEVRKIVEITPLALMKCETRWGLFFVINNFKRGIDNENYIKDIGFDGMFVVGISSNRCCTN